MSLKFTLARWCNPVNDTLSCCIEHYISYYVILYDPCISLHTKNLTCKNKSLSKPWLKLNISWPRNKCIKCLKSSTDLWVKIAHFKSIKLYAKNCKHIKIYLSYFPSIIHSSLKVTNTVKTTDSEKTIKNHLPLKESKICPINQWHFFRLLKWPIIL